MTQFKSSFSSLTINQYRNQSVRDLVWAVFSPPLVANLKHNCIWLNSAWFSQLYEGSLPWLRALDADSAELDELLAKQKDRRLGKYFETLWAFWLQHCSRYEVVENNLQIIVEGETLGEIDFILFDKLAKKTLHWEVAVKFYLGVDDLSEMHNWHGPNRRDRLDIKVEHLMYRQSVISEDARVKPWLASQGIHIDECAVILKGRLYYPWSQARSQHSLQSLLPLLCAEDLLYGYWFNESEFDEYFDGNQRFECLIKQGWMAKKPTEGSGTVYAKRDIYEGESKNIIRFPLHLQPETPCCSCDRVFLVGENWAQ